MKFEDLQKLTLEWADDKDLLHAKNAKKQFMKFIEEVFEFKTEFDNWVFFREKCGFAEDEELMYMEGKSLTVNSKLEMGDIFVTLIILCEQVGIDPVECLSMAYEKMQGRLSRDE
ncbi:MazG-like family protein [uncultured Anaerococcus sp.]|uniref:MazG-like family protein n=1 Tax=uncultured Anaerococcus sp. TaxID=293428 RepID=UPI00288B7A7A|nr:MazG-like family protein [uncultured Anaerococcus sp.]